ncbi:MAG: hypothetical protein WCD79_01290 [Chthoniobacteraceae bacterium]
MIEPDRVAPGGLDIIEFADEARQVADSITICIQKTLRMDFVKNGG